MTTTAGVGYPSVRVKTHKHLKKNLISWQCYHRPLFQKYGNNDVIFLVNRHCWRDSSHGTSYLCFLLPQHVKVVPRTMIMTVILSMMTTMMRIIKVARRIVPFREPGVKIGWFLIPQYSMLRSRVMITITTMLTRKSSSPTIRRTKPANDDDRRWQKGTSMATRVHGTVAAAAVITVIVTIPLLYRHQHHHHHHRCLYHYCRV